MTTILHASPIFGPVHSRRLGVSLGINLLPATGKVCTFDCIYCECGRNAERKTQERLPTREFVVQELEKMLQKMKTEGVAPDVLTFAGNGEPTAHPHFAEIVDDVIATKNRYFPNARISVLTNGTQVHKPKVFSALLKVDDNILKLDTVDDRYIQMVDRPASHYSAHEQVEHFARFNGHAKIQTMFMKGVLENGFDVDNTSDAFVLPWLEALKVIKPQEVMIYTIDRETPDKSLQKASAEVLDAIAKKVEALGLKVKVSY